MAEGDAKRLLCLPSPRWPAVNASTGYGTGRRYMSELKVELDRMA
jgi:hypothetical protein